MATAQTSLDDLESLEVDALTHLEERIQKTVALVNRLREEKEAAAQELASAQALLAVAQSELADKKAELAAANSALSEAKTDVKDSRDASAQLSGELSALRSEKLQVRNRLEKLLGQIDQLGAA